MQPLDNPFLQPPIAIALPNIGTSETTIAIETVPVVAQQFKDPDLFGQVQRAWSGFVSSGQIWALLIGLIIGYTFRKFST